jgi:hypothetical protein
MGETRPDLQGPSGSPRVHHERARVLLLFVLAFAFATVGLLDAAPAALAANPIVTENQQPGTTNWQLGRPGFHTADDTRKQIKGFASATSVNKGGTLTFYATVSPVQTFNIDFYRLGWYGGTGGRRIQHVQGVNGLTQPSCPMDPITGLLECTNWSATYTLNVPTDWTTGVYLALLTNSQNYQNYITFVVRDDDRPSPLLYQLPVNTYQAYNDYPNDGATGKSLYPFNSYGANTITGNTRAVKVSFDRPYHDDGAGDLIVGQGTGELDFIQWLEKSGYDVTYSTDVDTSENGSRLLLHSGFITSAHGEYWSKPQRDAVEAARDAGVNLGFFSGNEMLWQVRYESSGTGVPARVVVCYKNQASTLDPVQGDTTTSKWRDPPVNRPEQTVLGIQTIAGAAFYLADDPYVVTNSSSWVYTGTGLNDGDSVSGIVGYEWERYDTGYPYPVNRSYTTLSISPVPFGSTGDHAESSIYQAPSGAWVFDAGTIWWGYGLNEPGIVDPRIQQTTANILNRFVTSYERPATGSQFEVPLVPVFRQCGTGGNPGTGSHEPPLSVTSCTPVGTPEAVVHFGNDFVGSAALAVVPGDFTTAASEADVSYQISLVDIRSGSQTGPDYDPNPSGADMTFDARIRLTDTASCTGAGCSAPYERSATTVDAAFPIPLDCAPTPGDGGSDCGANTTANAVAPGMIQEGNKTSIQFFRASVRDSGLDGVRGNADDKLVAQQGLFVP